MINCFKPLLACLVFLGSMLPGLAQASEIISRDALRDAAYAGQVDKVEAAFATAHAEFLAGDASANDLRWLTMVMTVSHPKMKALTLDWLRKYPESPYAHTVQAWIYNDIAWNHRGPLWISKTHPDAIQSFQIWHHKALEHALYANAQAPRFIPASDAIIKFGNGAGSRQASFEMLDTVMKTDPNFGSLNRALWLASAGWGGNAEQAIAMCDAYAPGLEIHIDIDSETWCRLAVWRYYYPEALNDWAYDLLHLNDDPIVAEYRIYGNAFRWGWNGPEDARYTFEYLTRDGLVWTDVAEVYDLNIPRKYGHPFLYAKHQREEQTLDLNALKLDPYNPDLIKSVLDRPIPGLHFDTFGNPLVSDAAVSETDTRFELLRRQLIAAPYQSRYWWAMSAQLLEGAAPKDLLKADPYLINSVVYSLHHVWDIKRLMQNKMDQYELVQDMKSGKVEGDWTEITHDLDADILCPALRAVRLYQKICFATEGTHEDTCTFTKYYQADVDAAMSDATTRGVCTKERFSPVSWLYHTPVKVDLETLPHSKAF